MSVAASSVLEGRASTARGAGTGRAPTSELGGLVEQDCDVAIIGGGLTGLSCAVALTFADPRLRITVFESRPAPGFDPIGGAVRLQQNALTAAAAISPRLRDALLANSAVARQTLLHDCDAGTVITRLQPPPLHTSGRSHRTPAPPSALPTAGSPTYPAAAATATATSGAELVIGWAELEQLLVDQLPEGTVQWDAAVTELREDSYGARLGLGGAGRERGTVRAAVVVAADGALSAVVRGYCPPGDAAEFQGTVRFTGRLAGDLLATVPSDQEAWFLALAGEGAAFNSHPLPNGDVAWAAVASVPALRAHGLRFDPTTGRVVEAGAAAEGTGQQRPPLANGGGAGGGIGGGGGTSRGRSSGRWGWGSGEAAEYASKSSDALAAAAPGTAVAGTGVVVDGAAGAEEEGDSSMQQAGAAAAAAGTPWALVQRAFASFPTPVRHVLANTPPGAVVEIPSYGRRGRMLPDCLGRGRIVILGEAAHPVPPTGLECSMALEDAAELAATVQEFGLTREALRRVELCRRPRWRHLMQVSAALSAPTAGASVSLHAAILDHARDLNHVVLPRLRPPRRARVARAAVRAAGFALMGWGAVLAAPLLREAAAALQERAGTVVRVRGSGGGASGGSKGVATEQGSSGSGGGMAVRGAAGGGLFAPFGVVFGRGVGGGVAVPAESSALGGPGPVVSSLGPAGAIAGSVVAPIASAGSALSHQGQSLTAAGAAAAKNGTPGPLRRLGRAVGNKCLAAAGAAGRPIARMLGNRASQRAQRVVADKLGAF